MSRMSRAMLKYVLIYRLPIWRIVGYVTEITRFSSRGNFLTDTSTISPRNKKHYEMKTRC